jgi:hypothetical protein
MRFVLVVIALSLSAAFLLNPHAFRRSRYAVSFCSWLQGRSHVRLMIRRRAGR